MANLFASTVQAVDDGDHDESIELLFSETRHLDVAEPLKEEHCQAKVIDEPVRQRRATRPDPRFKALFDKTSEVYTSRLMRQSEPKADELSECRPISPGNGISSESDRPKSPAKRRPTISLTDMPLEILDQIAYESLNGALYFTCRKARDVLYLSTDEPRYLATIFCLMPEAFGSHASDHYADYLLDLPWVTREHIADAYCWWLKQTTLADLENYFDRLSGCEIDSPGKDSVPERKRWRKFLNKWLRRRQYLPERYTCGTLYVAGRPRNEFRQLFYAEMRIEISYASKCGVVIPVVSMEGRLGDPYGRKSAGFGRIWGTRTAFLSTDTLLYPYVWRRLICLPNIAKASTDSGTSAVTCKPYETVTDEHGVRKFLAAGNWMKNRDDTFVCLPHNFTKAAEFKHEGNTVSIFWPTYVRDFTFCGASSSSAPAIQTG